MEIKQDQKSPSGAAGKVEERDDFANDPDSQHDPNKLVLDEEQWDVVRTVLLGHNVFVTGGAGTGKTMMARLIRTAFSTLDDEEVALVCQTESAAQACGGQTLHSRVGNHLAQESTEVLIKNTLQNPILVARWKKLKKIIIDEVQSINTKLFKDAAAIARAVRKRSDHLFGGIQVIAIGDFLGGLGQCSRSDAKHHETYLFQTKLWAGLEFKTVILKTNYRQTTDDQFAALLSRHRTGDLTSFDMEWLRSKIQKIPGAPPIDIVATTPEAEATNKMFMMQMNQLLGPPKESACYTSEYALDLEQSAGRHRPKVDLQDFHNHKAAMGKNFPGQHRIEIHQQMQVLLQASIVHSSSQKRLEPGTWGIVVGFAFSTTNGLQQALPSVDFQDGDPPATIPYVVYRRYVPSFGYVLCRRLPLTMGFSIKLRELQGRSVQCARMDLAGGLATTPGMAYMALSRVRDSSRLYIQKLPATADKFSIDETVRDWYTNTLTESYRPDPALLLDNATTRSVCWFFQSRVLSNRFEDSAVWSEDTGGYADCAGGSAAGHEKKPARKRKAVSEQQQPAAKKIKKTQEEKEEQVKQQKLTKKRHEFDAKRSQSMEIQNNVRSTVADTAVEFTWPTEQSSS
jgi:hypothetical protein